MLIEQFASSLSVFFVRQYSSRNQQFRLSVPRAEAKFSMATSKIKFAGKCIILSKAVVFLFI